VLYSYFCEFVPPGIVPVLLPHAGRDVPEADVGALELGQDQLEARPVADDLGEVEGAVDGVVHESGESRVAPGPPHQPKLVGVHLASALDTLVAGVVAHVVELVLLEEIGRRSRIALMQQTLKNNKVKFGTKIISAKINITSFGSLTFSYEFII